MDFTQQILADSIVDRAMAGNAAHFIQPVRRDHDAKMALAAILIPGMATMAFALVDHLQTARRQGRFQTGSYFLCAAQLSAS